MKVLNTHAILDAARDGSMISPAEALHLLQLTRDEDLSALRQAADELRRRQVGESVFYSNAFSLYLTNYCEIKRKGVGIEHRFKIGRAHV